MASTVFVVTFRGKRSRPLATREAAAAFAADLAGMGIVGEITEYAAELFPEGDGFAFSVGDEVELTDAEPKSDDRFVVVLEIDRAARRFYGQHEDESCEWFSFGEVVGQGRSA